MGEKSKKKVEFVYDLPYCERMELCKIMDVTDKWEPLASLMGYDVMTIRTFRRARQSPTDELLTEWGHRNGTVLKLFGYLSQMQHYQAMLAIKKFVDPEYHRLIYEGKGNLSKCKSGIQQPLSTKSTATVSVNFNLTNSNNVLPSKMDGIHFSMSSNAESKILNVVEPGEQVRRGSVGSGGAGGASQAPTLRVHHNMDNRRSPTGESSRARESPDLSMGVEAGPPMIKYKELEVATNGWDPGAVLGKGGFGIVYKGVWKNTPVAVKRTLAKEVDGNASIQMQQILAELRMLNAYRHDSVLPLYGFSIDGEDPCLIYQFMPNGSLEDRLLCRQGTAPLSWPQRLHISTETARGLQWLHTIKDKPLIHGDIKSANILLDSNFQPKIGDFGLAREGPQSQYTHMKISKIHGTRPYLPDEFLRARKFSTKVDTHCFGIVLFELATGLRPYDEHRNHKYLRELIEQSSDAQITHLIDRKVMSSDLHVFLVLIDLGKLCVKHKPKDRPEMVTVLQALEVATAQRVRTQQQAVQGGHRSVSPFDLQRHYDQLSHHRTNNNGSPFGTSTPPRIHSPMPMSISPQPDVTVRAETPGLVAESLAVSSSQPGGRLSPLISSSPSPVRMGAAAPVVQKHWGPFPQQPGQFSPALADAAPPLTNIPELDSTQYSQDLIPATILGQVEHSPVIAISPPSDSYTPPANQRTNSTSTGNTVLTTEEHTSDSQFSVSEVSAYNIPNISALGIKADEPEIKEEEGSVQMRSASAPTTAKGKALWIMGGSG